MTHPPRHPGVGQAGTLRSSPNGKGIGKTLKKGARAAKNVVDKAAVAVVKKVLPKPVTRVLGLGMKGRKGAKCKCAF